MDAIRQIQIANAGRDPERLEIKYRKMRSNTFAFFAGDLPLFYDRLPQSAVVRNAPLVWVCGDFT